MVMGLTAAINRGRNMYLTRRFCNDSGLPNVPVTEVDSLDRALAMLWQDRRQGDPSGSSLGVLDGGRR
jgi:hypothetical protein